MLSDRNPAIAACASVTRVYVMRHGQSTYNAEGRFQGCSDEPDLTEAGVAAAEAAAAYLHDADLHAVITSPLKRASHTAVRIYQRVLRSASEGPCFALDGQLREIELPLWEGMAVESVRREYAGPYRVWREQPHLFRMPEDRSPVADLFRRTGSFWPGLLQRYAGRTVLLVTHGGTARALINTALGIPKDRFHAIQQSNAGLNVLEFPNQTLAGARVLTMNATDYLGERLPKLKESKTGLRILLLPAGAASLTQLRLAEQILQNVPIHAAYGDSVVNREIASRLLRGGVNGGIRPRIIGELPDLIVPERSLTTVLWVLHEKRMQRILANIVGLRHSESRLFFPKPFTFTVLNYPNPYRPAVLQAMNLHDTGRLTRRMDLVPARCA